MNTIEKNKLIAEFMGIKFKDDELYLKELREMKANGIYFEQGYMSSELKYHTSWDWLMPVIEEIDHQEYESERLDKIDLALKTRSIKDAYNAVVEAIKWYNENKLNRYEI